MHRAGSTLDGTVYSHVFAEVASPAREDYEVLTQLNPLRTIQPFAVLCGGLVVCSHKDCC